MDQVVPDSQQVPLHQGEHEIQHVKLDLLFVF